MDITEVEKEIRRYEAEKTTWSNCEKLAILYTVKDHLREDTKMISPPREPMPMYSYAAPRSEFVEAASTVPLETLLSVMDNHMEAIKVLYPKEYASVVRQLRTTE